MTDTMARGGDAPGLELSAACRLCCCTDDMACDGGCWWVDDPADLGLLCSACLHTAEVEMLLEVGRHLEVLDVIAAVA